MAFTHEPLDEAVAGPEVWRVAGPDASAQARKLAANGLAPFTKVGGDFQSYVDGLVAEVNQLSKDIGVIQ